MTLILFVSLYLAVTVAIGVYAATRVSSARDFAIAGQRLPLIMVITTTFATWFASETVLGVPAKFMEGGLTETTEDPYGAGLGLVVVGMFFARLLYRQNLLTIGDFYRRRYDRSVEMFSSAVILLSYLGWVAAQITALGLVFSSLTDGALTSVQGMVLGTAIVLVYTALGGMWSVAIADLLQMFVIVGGLLAIAVLAGDLAGGVGPVVAAAADRDLFRFFPAGGLVDWLFWISASMTLLIGSIPQQDVFQRVMAARDEDTAVRGPVIGGIAYMLFASVPMFIGVAALIVMPEAELLLGEDAERIIPDLVLGHMPLVLQVIFFGALLSAIMSTASATLLAPSTTFVENILRNLVALPEDRVLPAMRLTLVVFSFVVLAYAIAMDGTPIYDLVAKAYQFPVVGAFWPLAVGLYGSRASTRSAILSIVFGMGTWAVLDFTPLGEVCPDVLGGFVMGGVGIWLGMRLWPATATGAPATA
ncbi:MAG: sodium:solute symporter family protein [Pseudomonadales bacterium]|jgi:Na+/proline symporter|nr:sodium:solute symporter family protein [Pseudomonadales bacterium]